MLLAPQDTRQPLGVDNLNHFCIEHAPIGQAYWLHDDELLAPGDPRSQDAGTTF
jgi:hypothetical protein